METLRKHLLPRIMQSIKNPDTTSVELPELLEEKEDCQRCLDGILFKGNRMYEHRVIRFRYTTYDVRRSEDVVNPNTPHCYVMMHSNNSEEPFNTSPFLYAQVLGIYHVNAAYVGPGMRNNSTNRYDFLWVRWFDLVPEASSYSSTIHHAYKLDVLTFPSMSATKCDAFGFVDPNNVLHGCHIIPQFSKGLCYPNRKGLSKLAQDKNEWRQYFISRWLKFCLTPIRC